MLKFDKGDNINEITIKDIKELVKGLDNIFGQLSAVSIYFIDEEFIKNYDEEEKENLETIIEGKLEENINKIFVIENTYVVEEILVDEKNLQKTLTEITNNLKRF